MEALKIIKNYANITDNVWLTNKIEILEKEIEIESIKQKIKLIKELKK